MNYLQMLNKLNLSQADADFNKDVREIILAARENVEFELEPVLREVVEDLKAKVTGLGDLGAMELIALIGNVVIEEKRPCTRSPKSDSLSTICS